MQSTLLVRCLTIGEPIEIPRSDNDAERTQNNSSFTLPLQLNSLCGIDVVSAESKQIEINCAERGADQLRYYPPGATRPWSNTLVELARTGLWINNLLSEHQSTLRPSTLQIHMYCFLLDEIACMCPATVQPKNTV